MHCDLRLRLSFSLRLFGNSPHGDGLEVGGGGRGGGLWTEPLASVITGNFEVLGAGVGLTLLGFILVLVGAAGLMDVRNFGEAFETTFDCGGGGAGRFFLLFDAYVLLLLPVDNAGEEGERRVIFA